MPLLNDQIRNDVREMLSEVANPVLLVVFTQADQCEYCDANRELAEEVASLSEKISVEVYDFDKDGETAKKYGIDKIPAIAVLGAKDYGIRLYGIPSGYEFGTLIEDIRMVSSGESGLSPATRETVAKVQDPVHIQVFSTPTCPYCPQAVLLAHRLAMESELIHADMVEAYEFPQLATRYQVMGVPRTVINDTIQIEGAMPEPMLMREFAKLLNGKDGTSENGRREQQLQK
jgi:glutaredoxin-like protein